jgi:hypothetical protein
MRRRWRQLVARGAVHVARLDARRPVHWILLRVLPGAIARRFDPPADQLEATFELVIRDPRGREPARFALTVAGQSCSVRPGAAQQPGARAMIGSDDLILLASGAANWPELLSNGRFELAGDPFLALRFASLFKLPYGLEPV